MTTDNAEAAGADLGQRRRARGPKTFPTLSFEEVLVIARGVHEHGVGNEIRRITLFDKLGRKPESGPSRQLVTTSARYGLTSGSNKADSLKLTDDGAQIVDLGTNAAVRRRGEFDLAIQRQEMFAQLYGRLKDQRLPAEAVMLDELAKVGIAKEDLSRCSDVFLKNLRYLGLVQKRSGVERVITIEEAIEALGVEGTGREVGREEPARAVVGASIDQGRIDTSGFPDVHIDIQIHIDSTATPEQIDQIFVSMARHLYRRERSE